jgi:hypothetical protein
MFVCLLCWQLHTNIRVLPSECEVFNLRRPSMQCASVISSVVYPAFSTFSALSHTRHDFLKKVSEHKTCVLISSTILSKTFIILRTNERDMNKNVYRSSWKVLVILSDCTETWIPSTDFRKTHKYHISWKSVYWQPNCSTRSDGRTDGHNEPNSLSSESCERA